MKKILYLECYTGISGDMMVAALLDLGADQQVLLSALESLPLEGFSIEISRVKKAGLDVCDFKVKLDAEHENHDHDMEYLHGHSQKHQHSHHHQHDHHHHSSNEQETETVHSHEHRGMSEVLDIIGKSKISQNAAKMAVKIFEILAQAEAKAHGTTVEQVHFHEVGAVDSIVDIVAAAVCLDDLGITEAVIPFLCEGTGTVRCQHGILPIPVPAVVNVVQEHQLPLRITDIEGELVTPTGAAIAAALRTDGALPEQFVIERVGLGAGKRQYQRPSILRAMLLCEQDGDRTEIPVEKKEDIPSVYKLETNIDDCTGEVLGYVMEKLFAEGARDVHYMPVFMKKNRPAYQLNVICQEEQIERMERIIFNETTTIGIRRVKMERSILDREAVWVETEFGRVKAKRCTLPNGETRNYPEYESAAQLARERSVPLEEVLKAVR